MIWVSVIIPNYNGMAFLKGVLDSLKEQTFRDFEIILVDNGSGDGSREFVSREYPAVRQIALSENFGFSRAVNEGILASKAPYVLLLNNDTETAPDFVEKMLAGIRRHKKAFSCQALMLKFRERDKIDDAGNYYCALGWAFARGKDADASLYRREEKIFSCCAGAAIYRKRLFEKTGLFDNEHFAYLEDLDIGYRARLYGYENWFIPDAVVYHVGSGTSGSRYNQFKIRYSSRNNIYMIYKNMPLFQILLNLPFLVPGFLSKIVFFGMKGYGREYLAGIKNGFELTGKGGKQPFSLHRMGRYMQIQRELYANILLRLCKK